jgi:hypothetical protein
MKELTAAYEAKNHFAFAGAEMIHKENEHLENLIAEEKLPFICRF